MQGGVLKRIQTSVNSGGSSDTARRFTDFAVTPDNRAASAPGEMSRGKQLSDNTATNVKPHVLHYESPGRRRPQADTQSRAGEGARDGRDPTTIMPSDWPSHCEHYPDSLLIDFESGATGSTAGSRSSHSASP